MTGGSDKDALVARLDKVKVDMLFMSAEKLVEQAERWVAEPYISTAQDAVSALPEDPRKDVLQALLDALKNDGRDEAYDQLLADATRKMELAEVWKREPYLTTAQDAVNGLPAGADKDTLCVARPLGCTSCVTPQSGYEESI